MAGSLYLIPVTLGGNNFREVIPDYVVNITLSLRHFIAEDLRSARRYLKLLNRDFPIDDTNFYILDENTKGKEFSYFLEPLLKGHDMGLMSEAGIPCIADPGADVVRLAHKMSIKVVPLSGPSSILLALAASGFNGQRFVFHGYLPVKEESLRMKLKEIEKRAGKGETQIFMETPYRAQRMFEIITTTCNSDTLLCIAADITLPGERIKTDSISEWKKNPPELKNKLTIFLLNRS